MIEPIFKETLRVPKDGEKVHELTSEDVADILRLRGQKVELDPGMGGVSPEKLDALLNESSELVSLDLALTADCNFKCIHCYRPGEEWGKLKLPFDTVKQVVSDACELGVRFFVLTGGEPLMYKDDGKGYFDVVDLINEKIPDAKVLTFTDVALITPKMAQMLVDRRVGLCLKRDTLDHDTQNRILQVKRGSQQMVEGYGNLFVVGYGRDSDLGVSVNQVLRKGEGLNTLDGAIDLHLWIRGHGMEHSVVPIHYCGEALDDSQQEGIHPLEVKAFYDILAAIDAGIFNDPWTVFSPFPKNRTCNRPGRGVHIRATGKVTSCSESPLVDEYIFGDIFQERLLAMMRSGKFKGFRKEFAERDGKYICNDDVCDLSAMNLCRGGCATRSAYSRIDPDTGLIDRNEDMLAYSRGREDPLCPGWVVLAQKQGVLREGVYEQMVDHLLDRSALLDPALKGGIRERVVSEFNAMRGAYQ